MSETPGQICYEGYWQDTRQMLRGHPWDTLPPTEQAHWEAAAQAVLAMERPTPEPPHVTQAALAGQALLLDLDPDVRREEAP